MNQNQQIHNLDRSKDNEILQISESIRQLNERSRIPQEINEQGFPIPTMQSNSLLLKFQQSWQSNEINSIKTPKRQNPIQIHPNLIKRIKKIDEIKPQHQIVIEQQDNNRRITQYFGYQRQCMKKIETNKQQYQKNPTIRALKDKILKKNKLIEQMTTGITKLKQKNKDYIEEYQVYKKQQQKIIIKILSESYRLKIFHSGHKELEIIKLEKQTQEKYNKLETQFKQLKDQKEKKKKIKREIQSDQESNTFLDQFDKDRKDYLIGFMDKIKKDIIKIQSDRQNINDELYYQLPSFFNGNQVFYTKYLSLCTLKNYQDTYQTLMIDLQTLKYQSWLFIKSPTFISNEKLKQIYTKLLQTHRKCKILINTYTILHNTIAQQYNHQYILVGRQYWERSNLLETLLKYYENLPESMVKYIIKYCLKIIIDIKNQTNQQIILTLSSIRINYKGDIKVNAGCQWILLYFKQYRYTLGKSQQYYYCSPELIQGKQKDVNSSIWSLGILFYEMLFGKKPFEYVPPINLNSDQFYLIHQLVIPQKPVISPLCKQFIISCLSCVKERIRPNLALKHPYFTQK